jgi:hypothetical protein
MVLTLEKIKRASKFEQVDVQILLRNLNSVASDTEESMRRKILDLTLMRETFLKNTDIDALSDSEASNFIGFISKINFLIEAFEIAIGDKDIDALMRASKRFAQKTQLVIGMTD